MSEPCIVFDDVVYQYAANDLRNTPEGGALALDGVNLAIQRGDFVAVIGHNGSGKSTLARHVNALLLPKSGRVSTAGMDTAEARNTWRIRSLAGMVFQNPDSQMVAGVVEDDVAFGPENLAVASAEIAERVDAALDAVRMAEWRKMNPARLSGGQKQRVCIAGVLAMRPQILLLDEPGAMLDVRGRRGVLRVAGELNDAGITVVLVTHSMEEAANARLLIVMDKGRIVMQGTPREVFGRGGELRALGMEVPFTIQLGDALRERGIRLADVASPTELADSLAGALADAAAEPQAGALAGSRADAAAEPQAAALAGSRAGAAAEPQAAALAGSRADALADRAGVAEEAALAPTEPAIVFENVSFSYGGAKTARGLAVAPALEGISLRIPKGSLAGIMGHTGSGKSTLLQLAAGLLTCKSGSIAIDGASLASKAARRSIHAKVGIVFQYPEQQLFARTVAEDVAFGPRNAGYPAQAVERCVRESMEKMGLDFDAYAQRSPFELSGGERRRVALAGVIATDPDILIFDEPTAALDPRGRSNIIDFIQRLHASGKTVLMVSHSMDDMAQAADLLIVLNRGRVAMQGRPEEVFSRSEELRSMNLGLPQPMSYALKLRQRGFALPGSHFTLDALADAIAAELAPGLAAEPGREPAMAPGQARGAVNGL